jgi:uracil-DNA glycosylase
MRCGRTLLKNRRKLMSQRSSPYEEGDPNSKICFVGEAPSRVEIRLQRPFVGPAGLVFEECLHTAGIIRRQCYITNVFEFETYKDKRTQSAIYKKGSGELLWAPKRGFTELGVSSLGPLKDRLDKCKANVIVPLGGCALDALYDKYQILKWRGSILESTMLDNGRKLVPTIHPAAVLRGQYTWRYHIIRDMKRAKEQARSSAIRLPARDLLIDPSFEQCLAYLKEMQDVERLATDVEIYNNQISCVSFSPDPRNAISIPFLGRDGGHRWSPEQEIELVEATAAVLANPISLKVNQNILFDMFMYLFRLGIHVKGPIGDTMVAFNLMYVDFKKGLDTICSLYTEEPYYKDDGKIWNKPFRDMDAFWRYNAKDACIALEAWINMEPEMKRDGYMKTHDSTVSMYNTLLYMMVKGLRVDQQTLEETRVDIQDRLALKKKELNDIAGFPVNALSPKQCKDYLYIHKGARPLVSPKTGSITTDDLALARLWRRHHWPEIKVMQDIRTLNKLGSGYLDVELDPDNRLRCSYNPRGTWTGRLSSSQTVMGTGLNMQNLDPAFKAFIIPDED